MALCNSPTFPKPPRPGGKANMNKGIANVLMKMYQQLQEAETTRKGVYLPSNTLVNIAKCKADIETLMNVLGFDEV